MLEPYLDLINAFFKIHNTSHLWNEEGNFKAGEILNSIWDWAILSPMLKRDVMKIFLIKNMGILLDEMDFKWVK